jgi:glycosyltransferase involved in cell wall biosynthesis
LTSNNEGTPVAVIEAMAAEVPVIATDVGGVRELISGCPRPPQAGDGGQGFRPPARLPACRASSPEGRDLRPGGNAEFGESEFEICERGVLVRKGDVRGFAKGLKYLLEHPEECREMGKRGRKYALEKHTTERLVSDMDRLYRSLLERHSR